MKKTILITVGILILILASALFAYLFFFGVPKSTQDVFSHFTKNTSVAPVVVKNQPSVVNTENQSSGKKTRFHQLTTRPVVGAVFIQGGIRYVERGTGYMYDIMFSDGKETKVSNTTIPNVVGAVFSSTGDFVALTTEESSGTEVVAGVIQKTNGGSFSGKTLPTGSREVSFVGTSTVNYLLPNNNGSTGYAYDVITDISKQLFSIPLSQVRVLWTKPLFVYTIPSALTVGHLYKVTDSALTYVTPGENGLMAIPYLGGLVVSKVVEGGVFSTNLGPLGPTSTLPLSLLPEKCARSSAFILYCAIDTAPLSGEYPDIWYKGKITEKDLFWKIDIQNGSPSLKGDPISETGREIDVAQISVAPDESKLWFINKNDDTLWDLDLTE